MSVLTSGGLTRYVDRAGRRYVCHAPRLVTILLAMGAFRAEWSGLCRAVHHRPDLLEPGTWRATLLGILGQRPSDSRAGRVLATCVEMVRGEPGDLEDAVSSVDGLAVDLTMACLSLVDVPRCFNAMGGPALGRLPVEDLEGLPADTADDITTLEAAIHALARAYGAGSATAVLAWPYEDFLSAVSVAPRLRDAGASEDAGPDASTDPAVLAQMQAWLGSL